MNEKEHQRFVREAKALLLSLGAVQHDDDFVLQTKAGRLKLHPEEETNREWLGTVYAIFDDPKAAVNLVDCNRFSGKWNHHYLNDWTVETALHDLKYQLGKVLIPADTPGAIIGMEETNG